MTNDMSWAPWSMHFMTFGTPVYRMTHPKSVYLFNFWLSFTTEKINKCDITVEVALVTLLSKPLWCNNNNINLSYGSLFCNLFARANKVWGCEKLHMQYYNFDSLFCRQLFLQLNNLFHPSAKKITHLSENANFKGLPSCSSLSLFKTATNSNLNET